MGSSKGGVAIGLNHVLRLDGEKMIQVAGSHVLKLDREKMIQVAGSNPTNATICHHQAVWPRNCES